MVEDYRLTFPPVLKVDFCTVFGCDGAHIFLFVVLFTGFVLICVGSPILVERIVRITVMVMARIYPLHLLLLYCYRRVTVALQSHEASAPDVLGENSRNGILCTPRVNPPRKQRMSFRPRSVTYGKSFLRALTREKRCLTCVNFPFLSSTLIRHS